MVTCLFAMKASYRDVCMDLLWISATLGKKYCHINLLVFIRRKYGIYFVELSISYSESQIVATQMANKTTSSCQQFEVTHNEETKTSLALNQRWLIHLTRPSWHWCLWTGFFRDSGVIETKWIQSFCFLQFERCCESGDMSLIKICSFLHLFRLTPCKTLLCCWDIFHNK